MKRRYLPALATVLLFTAQVLAQRGGFGARDVIPEGSRVDYKTFSSKLLNREVPGVRIPLSPLTSAKGFELSLKPFLFYGERQKRKLL